MHARPFGSTGLNVPVIGQGTWHIDATARDGAVAALRAGIDAGMTHIDTAEMYGDGEAIVGEAIRGVREEVKQQLGRLLDRPPVFELDEAIEALQREV